MYRSAFVRSLCARLLLFFSIIAVAVSSSGAEPDFLPGVRRVVVLGDSITYSGEYVDYLEAYAVTRFPDRQLEFLNLGLPSETVSGLSEPGHAGGRFPRPDLHERLARVLAQTKPDFIIACYGMNDGIYYPFGEDRFQKFKDGIEWLHEQATTAGAKILHVTPTTFDPVPIQGKTLPAGRDEYRRPYEGYNEVLNRYSDWLLAQRTNGWDVVDVHGPMNRFLAEQRAKNPDYRLSRDGVHIDPTGHWLVARIILRHLGAPETFAKMSGVDQMLATNPHGSDLLELIERKQSLRKDAWLTAVGHKRPGMKQGLPLAEAQQQAAALDEKILDCAQGR